MVDRGVQMIGVVLDCTRGKRGENGVRVRACYLRLRYSLARSMLARTTILTLYPVSDHRQFSPNNISA